VGKGTLGTWRFPTSAWVAGLIKPVQSPDAVLETRLWANHGVRVYANQRLSLGEEGKAYGGKAKTSNRTEEIPPSGIIGGHGKRRHGGNENPSCNRKSRNGNPPPKARRARALSQPQRKRREMDRPNLRKTAPVNPTKDLLMATVRFISLSEGSYSSICSITTWARSRTPVRRSLSRHDHPLPRFPGRILILPAYGAAPPLSGFPPRF
jgi:hypothetical protein